MIMTIPSDLIGPVSGESIGTDEGRLTDSEGHLLAHGTTTCLIINRSGNASEDHLTKSQLRP